MIFWGSFTRIFRHLADPPHCLVLFLFSGSVIQHQACSLTFQKTLCFSLHLTKLRHRTGADTQVFPFHNPVVLQNTDRPRIEPTYNSNRFCSKVVIEFNCIQMRLLKIIMIILIIKILVINGSPLTRMISAYVHAHTHKHILINTYQEVFPGYNET